MSPKNLCAFLHSRLDYCSSLWAGCPKHLLSKLQKVQNNAARLIFRRKKQIRPRHSYDFVLFPGYLLSRGSNTSCLLCFKIISHQAPIYLSELLHLYTRSRQLRSYANIRMFSISSFRTKSCGERSLSLTRLQLSGANSLFLSVILLLSVLSDLL